AALNTFAREFDLCRARAKEDTPPASDVERALNVIKVGGSVVAGDGGVVDRRRAEEGGSTADPDAQGVEGTGLTLNRRARVAAQKSADAGGRRASVARGPGCCAQGLVGGDHIRGLGLLRAFLRTLSGCDDQSSTRGVLDSTALPNPPFTPVAAGAADGIAAVAAGVA